MTKSREDFIEIRDILRSIFIDSGFKPVSEASANTFDVFDCEKDGIQFCVWITIKTEKSHLPYLRFILVQEPTADNPVRFREMEFLVPLYTWKDDDWKALHNLVYQFEQELKALHILEHKFKTGTYIRV